MADTQEDPGSGYKVAHFRIPTDLHARLAAFAKATERTMNGAAVFAIREFLDREGQPPAPESDVQTR